MNHRKGGLSRKDFDKSQWGQPASFFISTPETTSDFGVLNPGATFNKPAPKRESNGNHVTDYSLYALGVVCLIGVGLIACGVIK